MADERFIETNPDVFITIDKSSEEKEKEPNDQR